MAKKKSDLEVQKRQKTPSTQNTSQDSSSAGNQTAKGTQGPNQGQQSQKKQDGTSTRKSSRPGNEQRSNVNARKVSEGLQQLGPDAMRRLRDSYSLLDSDGSGTVDRDALRTMLQSLGLDSSDETIQGMVKRTGEPITFGSYLAVMAELMCGLPSRKELNEAMEAFQTNDGNCDVRELRRTLVEEGGLSSEEVDGVIQRFSKRSKGNVTFDMKDFVNAIGA